MPTIDSFEGLNIYNGDHRPPHIHVIYGEFEVLLIIENSSIYAGMLPAKKLKKTIIWLRDNKEWALEMFYELNPTLR